jgi:hypothetical protein
VSTDGLHWVGLGLVIAKLKNPAVVAGPGGVPVRIGGHYLMYYGLSGRGTYLAESTDFVHWTTVGTVTIPVPPDHRWWECGVAVTNYRTTAKGGVHHDIDLFISGYLMSHGRWNYAISEVEFRRGHLRTAAAELSQPVLRPWAPYERYGFTPSTVFTNAITFVGGRWWMYYGAADDVIALATARLR